MNMQKCNQNTACVPLNIIMLPTEVGIQSYKISLRFDFLQIKHKWPLSIVPAEGPISCILEMLSRYFNFC